jgi:hypothetical protein
MICCGPGSDLGWEWVLTPRLPALAQAIKFALSLVGGEPNLEQAARTLLADKACELF